ncbi:SAM-dependent methyltransferase [Streptomyces abikoensis]|uniref:SAM-dependent methyltransferase n=1 Tax=Streptomyces abikoensis TaxID=97398 RepID=UPI0034078479
MHRLETDQVSTFVEALGDLPATARILDAGCGRGGTSLLLHQACGCAVDGVNFSAYQVRFARAQAEQRGVADRVRFHEANMVATPFAAETFDHVISNETTMYVKLPEAFAEFTRVLKPGGTYVLTTWCVNDPFGTSPPEAAAIDRHYMSITHRRSEYLAALTGAGLFPYQMDDFTSRALPYWELRVESALASGVEQSYLTGYRTNQVNYMRICSRKALRQQGQGVA